MCASATPLSTRLGIPLAREHASTAEQHVPAGGHARASRAPRLERSRRLVAEHDGSRRAPRTSTGRARRCDSAGPDQVGEPRRVERLRRELVARSRAVRRRSPRQGRHRRRSGSRSSDRAARRGVARSSAHTAAAQQHEQERHDLRSLAGEDAEVADRAEHEDEHQHHRQRVGDVRLGSQSPRRIVINRRHDATHKQRNRNASTAVSSCSIPGLERERPEQDGHRRPGVPERVLRVGGLERPSRPARSGRRSAPRLRRPCRVDVGGVEEVAGAGGEQRADRDEHDEPGDLRDHRRRDGVRRARCAGRGAARRRTRRASISDTCGRTTLPSSEPTRNST